LAKPWALRIVMPVLDEAQHLRERLLDLQSLRERGVELVVVDGGSVDDTVAVARPLADRVLSAPRGRATQMNAGAQSGVPSGDDVLLFLHADTQLPEQADTLLRQAVSDGAVWGRFDVLIDSPSWLLSCVSALMNLRSRLTGIATGDQAMFVRREAFDAAGGFPAIALMEDIGLCSALKQIAPCTCLKARVITSARRWKARGPMRTLLLMWWLRAAYFFGADPEHLAVRYGYRPRDP
jgi:rSAM/selenodomain-associated transferase 2